MFYKYDKNKLLFIKDRKKYYIFICMMLLIGVFSFLMGRYLNIERLDDLEKEILVLNLENSNSKFSEEKLIDELKRLNVRFPHIVMAQSIVETGHWKSEVFMENHNLFGMKEAKRRVNTALGTNLNHAYYKNWQESLYDYAFYQCRYLSKIRTEDEYFSYLAESYAESPSYVSALRTIIERENLEKHFE